MNKTLSDIADRSKRIKAQMQAAMQAGGRGAGCCELIAVTKRQNDERIAALWKLGHRRFGENKVEEAERHWKTKRQLGESFDLHFIGHLQSNKAERAVALFDVIETVDSIKLAKKIDNALQKNQKTLQILVQVNTGEELQKHGVLPQNLPELLKEISEETSLKVSGLMCLPPKKDEPGLHFALLAKLASQHNLPQLSMGMSGDFETAIRFGSTSVRIGSAIFGAREL